MRRTEWSDLTESQREAICYSGGPLLIIAGPGSGKTEVLAWRVAYLINSGICKSDKVLVATFAEKAATELKDRIQEKIPHINIEMMQVSTIHSFCLKLLYKYDRYVKMPVDFRVLGDLEQLLFIYSHHEELGFDFNSDEDPYNLLSEVQHIFNLATEELVDPSDLADWCRINLKNCAIAESEAWTKWTQIASAYDRYLKLLHSEKVLDFASIQSCALDLIQNNPQILAGIKKRYQDIFIDEYQDTNAVQERIISLLTGDGNRFTAVGDDDQSIYRFRGATVRNILTFKQRFPKARMIKLEQNFRSKNPIVKNSLNVIENNPARIPKDLTSVRGIGSDVLVVHERNFTEEAKASVGLLRKLHNSGKIGNYGDIAVLFRSVEYHALPYIIALRDANIPFSVAGDARFFRRADISNICNLFRFLNITKKWGDNRYLNNTIFGFDPKTYKALEKMNRSLMETSETDLQSIGITDSGNLQRLMDLADLKRQIQNGNYSSMLDVYYRLLRCTNCACRFEQNDNQNSLINLGLLSQLIGAWDEYGGTNDLQSFLRYLEMLKQVGVSQITFPPNDAIQIMSIHQAKGLEFPVVLMGSTVNGHLPNRQRSEKFHIPYDLCASGKPEVEDPHLVDERKLFYVAATRARDLLIVGTADIRTDYVDGPSIFLKEMFGENLEKFADLTKSYVDKVESKPRSNKIRTRYNFSKLSYFFQCPLRYKYTIIYNFYLPRSESRGYGDNVHRALEAIHHQALEGRSLSDQEVVKIVEDKWIVVDRAKPDQERKLMDAACNQICRYMNGYGKTLSSIIEVEAGFAFDLNGRIIQGTVDLLKRNSVNEVEIVDFKTSEMPANNSIIRKQNIDLQLDIYALGVENALGLKVAKATAHFLGDGNLLTTDWSPDRRANALLRLSNVLDDIANAEFAPNQYYCAFCYEFKEICPFGQLSVVACHQDTEVGAILKREGYDRRSC